MHIDIAGDGANVLTLDTSEIFEIAPVFQYQLIVSGDADDTVNATGFSTAGTTQTIDGVVYNLYSTGGLSAMLVEESVTVVV